MVRLGSFVSTAGHDRGNAGAMHTQIHRHLDQLGSGRNVGPWHEYQSTSYPQLLKFLEHLVDPRN